MKKKNFTQVPNLAFRADISDGAFRTYVILLSFKYGDQSKVFPSHKFLGNIVGVSTRTIAEHTRQLKNANMIASHKRGYSSSNEYTFNHEDMFLIDPKREDPLTLNKKISSSQTGTKIHPNNTKINIKDKNKGYEMLRKKAHKLNSTSSVKFGTNYNET